MTPFLKFKTYCFDHLSQLWFVILDTITKRLNRWLRATVNARNEAEMRKHETACQEALAARRAACRHRDTIDRPTINLVHNFPDGLPRGVCVHCGDWIHPAEWQFTAPTRQFPRGKPFIIPAHPLYMEVIHLENEQLETVRPSAVPSSRESKPDAALEAAQSLIPANATPEEIMTAYKKAMAQVDAEWEKRHHASV